jgi:hypothetical protein
VRFDFSQGAPASGCYFGGVVFFYKGLFIMKISSSIRQVAAVVLAVPCILAFQAQAATDMSAGGPEAVSTETPDLGAHVCAGIGDEGREEMRAVRGQYNLHLSFAEANTGSYLIPVTVSIDQIGGDKLALGPFEDCGPLLYVNLPAGQYRVTAIQEGVTKTKTVRIGRRSVNQVMYWPAA